MRIGLILLFRVIQSLRSFYRFRCFIRRKLNLPDSVYVCNSIDEALILTQGNPLKSQIENIFVIGGGQIYKQAITLQECSKLYITEVDNETPCDTFFPEIPTSYKLTVWSHMIHYVETRRRYCRERSHLSIQ